MEEKTAIEYLTAHEGKKASEIGRVVDVLYQKYHSYQAIAQRVGMSSKFWSARHRIFQLPKGIQWKIDQGQIGITQGHEISRLENEYDQWLLALAIIEEKLTPDECKNVVNIVLKQNGAIRDVLSISTGVRFDKIQTLILPLGFDTRLAICQSAWNQCKNWEDLCYELIRQGIDVDIKKIASQLEALASDLREAGQEKTKP